MRNIIYLLISFTLVFNAFALIGQSWQEVRPPAFAFDPGPDLDVPMQRKLIDLHAEIPSFPGISEQIAGEQKFRPAYGPIPWRMIIQPNSVKILFIGQDGTHVAEAAGRPATAGFGGRAQDLAQFFGVEYSAAFINAYAFTINGQYGSRGAPYIMDGELRNIVKKDQSRPVTITPNDVWMMSQHPSSPITQWRNELIEWIIQNNQESLKMIVLFGQAAKDSIATYIEARGGKVGSWYEDKMKNIQVPLFTSEYAGGNNVFPVPVGENGKDLFATFLDDRMSYAGSDKNKAINYATANQAKIIDKMVFTQAGPYKNGLLHYAQFGGYDLDKISINGIYTKSLKGLRLKNGSLIQNDVLVTALPHPTYLSRRMIEATITEWEKLLKEDRFSFNEAVKSARFKDKDHSDVIKVIMKQRLSQARKDDDANQIEALETLLSLEESLSNDSDLREAWESYIGKDSVEYYYATRKAALRKIGNFRHYGFYRDVLSDHPDQDFASSVTQSGYVIGKEVVGEIVEKDVSKLRPFADKGWNIPADASSEDQINRNTFAEGKQYEYGRSDINNVFYDFGTPKNRMVSESDARRGQHRNDAGNKGPQIIIFGDRNVPPYDKEKMDVMLAQQPNEPLSENEMFISRVRTPEVRYTFDPGPSEKYAKLMKDLDFDAIYSRKNGSGIDAYNIKSHPSIGDFGHYRGTFDNPKVVILADPDGFDDLITARALTGTRGQYLQGLMNDLGVEDNYLVIKTVPYGMDEATEDEWQETLKATSEYRENLIKEILKDSNPELIISDGTYATAELKRILTPAQQTKLVYIAKDGLANDSGIAQVASYIKRRYRQFSDVDIRVDMDNIPKSHLTYYARAWEGTSGDRVLNSLGSQKGKVFSEVCPDWVVDQEFKLQPTIQEKVDGMIELLGDYGFPLPGEKIPTYLERKSKLDKDAA